MRLTTTLRSVSVCLLFLSSAASPCAAGLLDHELVWANYTLWPQSNGLVNDAQVTGNGPLLVGLTSPIASADAYGNSSAHSGGTATDMFEAHSYAHTAFLPYQYGYASTFGLSRWTDVTYVDNAGPSSPIRLSFEVHAQLQAQGPGGGYLTELSQVSVAFNSATRPLYSPNAAMLYAQASVASQQVDPIFSISTPVNWGVPWGTVSWDSAGWLADGSFVGTFSFLVSYDSVLNGYGWNMQLRSLSGSNWGGQQFYWPSPPEHLGYAQSDATAKLVGVKFANGAPVTGLQFDSGINLSGINPVPEPATIFAAVLGALALLARRGGPSIPTS